MKALALLRLTPILFLGLLLAGCGPVPDGAATPATEDAANAAPVAVAAPAALATSVQNDPSWLPNPKLTPGDALDVTTDDVCVSGYSARVRNVPISVKREAYAEYGIAHHAPREYEVDHLISLELGGSNSLRNLWPESYLTQPWNAHVKDQLENELHDRACGGQITLKEAQTLIAGDWIAAYKQIFATNEPLLARGKSTRTHRHRRSYYEGE